MAENTETKRIVIFVQILKSAMGTSVCCLDSVQWSVFLQTKKVNLVNQTAAIYSYKHLAVGYIRTLVNTDSRVFW